MSLRIERNFILPVLDRLEDQLNLKSAKTATATPTQKSSVTLPGQDLGAQFLRQQLQSVTSRISTAKPAQTSAIGQFNISNVLGFFTKLASNAASALANAVVSKVPSKLIEGGLKVASNYFGGEGGKGIDAETRTHLAEFGLDPRALSSARLYYNSPNAIKGFATTLGSDIHFGDRPNPNYWTAASELQNLINTKASPEAIRAGQAKLRNAINDFALLAHEVNHVAQQKRDGAVGMAANYVSDVAGGFVRNLLDQALSGKLDSKNIFNVGDRNSPLGKAYREVGYEQDSYELQLKKIEPELERRYSALLNYSA